jgi:type IV pilus assembly protein PilF
LRIKNLLLVLLLPALLTACVAVNPGKSQNEKASEINVQLGMGYLQQGNLELASEKLTKALRQNRKSASANNAYAILQDRLGQKDLAEQHYKEAIYLDPKDSQAANNYGAFLCRNNREAESEKHFLKALENPLYKTPEYAYTNAAICLIKIDRKVVAKEYLQKALASKSDFSVALLAMGNLLFDEGSFDAAKLYVDRYHLVAKPTSRSLWLAIRNELEIDGDANVDELAERLKRDFPDSSEYKSWLEIQ